MTKADWRLETDEVISPPAVIFYENYLTLKISLEFLKLEAAYGKARDERRHMITYIGSNGSAGTRELEPMSNF